MPKQWGIIKNGADARRLVQEQMYPGTTCISVSQTLFPQGHCNKNDYFIVVVGRMGDVQGGRFKVDYETGEVTRL